MLLLAADDGSQLTYQANSGCPRGAKGRQL
jgi:hypothetical protein